MERLTLDEAIKYIKEVVCKNRKNKEKNTIVIPNSFISSADCAEKYEQVAKWLKELKSYKEAEEQGLLVRLPCKVGDTVYKITRFCSGGIRDCGYSYECSECPEYKPFIEYIEFKITILKDIGKNVFLTREEAEKKLEEMKNDL